MNKKLTKVLAMFLCIVMALPLSAFASLGIFAEGETETTTEATYTEPTVTAEKYAYFSYSGNDSYSGLKASAPKKTMNPAFKLLTEGGTLVIPAKGYVSGDLTLTEVNGTVLITAKDQDGTLYFDPENPDVDSAQKGMFMIAAKKTVTFQNDVIFDDVVILQRACSAVANAANIRIDNNSTMVIGANTQFHHCTEAAGGNKAVCNSKLTVAEGSTLIVKAAGALSYNGAGTIYIDKNLVGNGVDASQFAAFTGNLYDLDGKPLCAIVGHSYTPTVVNHTYMNICGSCGDNAGAYSYTTPVLENTTDVYTFANNGTAIDSETVYTTFATLTAAMNSAENKGGTIYVTQKGNYGDRAYTYDVGAVSKFTAVLADGTDLREQNAQGEAASQNGALMWGIPSIDDSTVNFASDVIFEKINFYSRMKSNNIGIINATTAVFNEVEFKRSSTSYPYTGLIIEGGSTVIMNNVSGKVGKITGYGTLIVSIDIINSGVITKDTLENFNGIVMTTECKEICAFSGSHDYVDNVCVICGAEQGAVTMKLYVKKNGTGDGLTPENPTNSIRTGFMLASADPIEIILVDDLLISGSITCAATNQDVIITSVDLDGDGVYPKLIIQSWVIFQNEGAGNKITFKNIEIQSDRSGTVPFFFNYNNFEFGEGVTCTLSGNYEDGEYPTIFAGYLADSKSTVANSTNTYNTVGTISSGTWKEVIGGTRRNDLTYAFGMNHGSMELNITGGEILGKVSGTGSNFYDNDININVTGGSIGGGIYGVGDLFGYGGAAPYGEYGLKGDINIEVTGGTVNGGIYAKYPMTAVAALIRGDVTVTIGDITLDDNLLVDLRSTLAYAGQDKASYLYYGESLEGMVDYIYVDYVNDSDIDMGEPVRYAFVGDSITQGTGSTNRALYSAPAMIQKMLDENEPDTYMIGNFGVGASGVFETAGYYYNDTLQYHLLMEEFEPTWVSFALGTNDCQTAGGSAGAALRFEELYYTLIKGVADLDSVENVYVNTPLIRLDYISAWSRNVSVIEPAIKNVVAKLQANGVDATFIEMGAITAADILAGNILGKDNLHPGDEGYAKLAQYYYDAIFGGEVDVPADFRVDTIYISDNGTRTGAGTLEDPISDLPLALWKVSKTGGTIVIVDQFTTQPYTKSTTTKVTETVEVKDENGDPVLNEDGTVKTEEVEKEVVTVTEYPAYADFATPADITGTLTFVGNTTDAVFEWRGKAMNLECDVVFDSLTLRTSFDTAYINAHFNSVSFTETFKTETLSGYDVTLLGGYYAQADQSLIDTTADKLYDTAAAISSDKDVTININGGNFANIMLLNRRFDAKAPMGTYSGNMTVNFNGGKITGKASEATMRSGALSMCYLAGNMTVNFNGMEVEDGHVFYAVTRTATLSGIEKDNSLNTGSLTVNGDAIALDKYIRENMRTNDNDGQMATIENLSINCTSTVGDLDLDGSFTNADITSLVRYLSGWSVDGAKYTGDFTADNKVNNRDVIALIQKLNAGN